MLASKHFIGIHGYMLVYSVASQQSFEMVSIIRDKILNHLVGRSAHPFSPSRPITDTPAGRRHGSDHDCRQQM